MMTIVRRQTSGVVVAFAIFGSVLACGGSSANAPSTAPQVTGCSTASYQGTTLTFSGCDPAFGQAPSGFTSMVTTGGRTTCFTVTCANRCIRTVATC